MLTERAGHRQRPGELFEFLRGRLVVSDIDGPGRHGVVAMVASFEVSRFARLDILGRYVVVAASGEELRVLALDHAERNRPRSASTPRALGAPGSMLRFGDD